MMWKKLKQTISSRDNSINIISGRDTNYYAGNIPVELIDQKIEEDVEKIRKARFFSEFDRFESSVKLGRCLVKGDFSGGTAKIKGWGLAWCARILAPSDEIKQAVEFLEISKTLGDLPEAKIAEAFILSQKGDKAAALQVLSSHDTPASRGAAYVIVAYHDGAEDSLKWMQDVGRKVDDLDSDGKFFLLNNQLELGFWDDAVQTVSALLQTDFEETPALHHLAALTSLIAAVPDDFRAVILKQVPFEAHVFPLASDAKAMDARREAHEHFLEAVNVTKRLGCPQVAILDEEYALWLELRDPAQTTQGLERLQYKLRDPDTALWFVRYALQFGVKLDLDAVERDIDRHIAINGGMTIEAAIARFAIALTRPTGEDAARYIAHHQDQLAAHIDPRGMQIRQIEMYSHAGLIENANEVLNQLVKQGIPPEEERDLRNIIAVAEGADPVESRMAQYKTTGKLEDLINLVAELEKNQRWDSICEFGNQLFEKTRSLDDAERLVNAFNFNHKSGALVEFLRTNDDLLTQSKELQMSYAWGLFHEGDLLESREVLTALEEDAGSLNYRSLHVNLLITMGDWPSLLAYVVDEYRNIEQRSATDLMSTAQIALHLKSPHAKDLVCKAAEKAGDDASILATAYFVAASAGWEDDSRVFNWLERAASLSDGDGPLQRMSLQDIFEQKPEWDRQESETWDLLSKGRIPIFLAAQSLNGTLISLMTFPALANLSEYDPRRRNSIPAYSGKHVLQQVTVTGKTVALDATALLTLSFLNILDLALDSFEKVFIPHSTLRWLFEEQQKAAFHQPSRIKEAHQIRNLLAREMIEKLNPTTVTSSDLSAQVGEELAALIAEAEKVRENDSTQHIVIRPAPVYRLSSLMEEEADLSAHVSVLSSCLAVVEKLRQKGQITAEEEKRARAFLKMQEKPWPSQPKIDDGATLYIDDLGINYLLQLKLVEKLKAAGLRVVVSRKEVERVEALISYETISDNIKDVIERIRAALNKRIRSGHVRVGSMRTFDKGKDNVISDHPTASVISLAPQCDFAIADDRFINQHLNIDYSGTLSPILTTLDLLESLTAIGSISEEKRMEYKTRLRRAGYFFIPLIEAELEQCLMASDVVDGEVVETAELKAIRESLLCVRMRDWLQPPAESLWLDETLKTLYRVLRNLWQDGADIDQATARSNWLATQIDVRSWAHCFISENADNMIRIGRGIYIVMLLLPITGVRQSVADAYWNWVEEKILAPIKEQFPNLYDWLVEWHRSHITDLIETAHKEGVVN